MRKIEMEVIGAFIKGQVKEMSNTRTDGVHLWLHGNEIARVVYPLPLVRCYQVTMAGWETPTTRSRINALHCLLGAPGRVHQSSGRQWYRGNEIDSLGWYDITL